MMPDNEYDAEDPWNIVRAEYAAARPLNATTIRAWRHKNGWTKREAAAMLNIPTRTYETLEAGRTKSSALWGPITRIVKLMEVCDE
jgi:DNA-binding transcriptional regulator YiaG